jgi:hypothetical protein
VNRKYMKERQAEELDTKIKELKKVFENEY